MNEQIDREVEKCVAILEAGGCILYPTDTIWGLGCDATNEDAVRRIYRIKQREDSKALISLVQNEQMLHQYVSEIPNAFDALRKAEKRPTTYIFSHVHSLAPSAIAADGSAALRIPNDAFCQALLTSFGKAIISTSANISGTPNAKSFDDIDPEIIDAVTV